MSTNTTIRRPRLTICLFCASLAITSIAALTGCNTETNALSSSHERATLALDETITARGPSLDSDEGDGEPSPERRPPWQECEETCPAGPPGPQGPAGEEGPAGEPGSPIDRNAIYSALSYRGPGGDAIGQTIIASCSNAGDILLNCTCQGSTHTTSIIEESPLNPLSDVTLVPIARNRGPGSDEPDQCLCLTDGVESGDVIAAMATCISATPLCDGDPPADFGEVCGNVCGLGTIGCDGTCDADPGAPGVGDDCVYAECSCGDIDGRINCLGECTPLTVLSSCCLFCGGYCPPF